MIRPGSSIVRANVPGLRFNGAQSENALDRLRHEQRAVGLALGALVATRRGHRRLGAVMPFMGLRVRQTNQRDCQNKRAGTPWSAEHTEQNRAENKSRHAGRERRLSQRRQNRRHAFLRGTAIRGFGIRPRNVERDRQNIGLAAGIHGDDQVDVTALFQERGIELIDPISDGLGDHRTRRCFNLNLGLFDRRIGLVVVQINRKRLALRDRNQFEALRMRFSARRDAGRRRRRFRPMVVAVASGRGARAPEIRIEAATANAETMLRTMEVSPSHERNMPTADGRPAPRQRRGQSDVQTKNLGGRGGPSNARPGGGAKSEFSTGEPADSREAIQDAGAITVPHAEQCPLAQHPRSQTLSVRISGSAGICARSSACTAATAGLTAAPSLTCFAACICGTLPWAAAPAGANATSRKATKAMMADATVRMDMPSFYTSPAIQGKHQLALEPSNWP